ncbi:hypothetical protein EV674_13527 [Simplicispira metamorpha]|uniref:Uncharacterized protein n=1 Tax=Simplicispira metamorpha TaxID=80881 RepID=A0A4R2N0R1_9BURK|nr:hypothetical protein EV674_13527 [Simplicispira metamorpha]
MAARRSRTACSTARGLPEGVGCGPGSARRQRRSPAHSGWACPWPDPRQGAADRPARSAARHGAGAACERKPHPPLCCAARRPCATPRAVPPSRHRPPHLAPRAASPQTRPTMAGVRRRVPALASRMPPFKAITPRTHPDATARDAPAEIASQSGGFRNQLPRRPRAMPHNPVALPACVPWDQQRAVGCQRRDHEASPSARQTKLAPFLDAGQRPVEWTMHRLRSRRRRHGCFAPVSPSPFQAVS